MGFLGFDLPTDGASGAGGSFGAGSGVDNTLSEVGSVVITALVGNLEVLEVLRMDDEGNLGAGDRSDLVVTGSGSGADF